MKEGLSSGPDPVIPHRPQAGWATYEGFNATWSSRYSTHPLAGMCAIVPLLLWAEEKRERARNKERESGEEREGGVERGRARNEEASRVERKEREEKSGVTERRVEQQ